MHPASSRLADYRFEPDGDRAVALDQHMHAMLLDSLGTIRDEAEGVVGCTVTDRLGRAGDAGQPGRPPRPAAWAAYSALCDAIALDDIPAANEAAADVHRALEAAPAPYVSNLDDRDLGVGYASLYGRTLDDDAARPLDLVALETEEATRARALIAAARDLIEDACPELRAEMDALVREIVLVKGRPGGRVFAGAATLFLWGALFINPTIVPDRLSMAEALTHETAHALLTGLTQGRNLTLNDPNERYASPLRRDARPMEGIAHAAFVLARMTMMLDRLAGSWSLDDDERARLTSMRSENASLFQAAMLTVRQHAKLTSEGAAIFAACETFMGPSRSAA